jgi:methionyl aminopeptidase
MNKVTVKTPEEIAIMREGGSKLAKVRDRLFEEVQEGVSAAIIENLASELIAAEGGEASFKMVPRYKWATCININDGVVHGIPHAHIVFKNGDIVSVDVGMSYKGFHTDTSFSKLIGDAPQKQMFLDVGKESLYNAIAAAKPGNRVRDISYAMEQTLRKHDLNPIRALTGHGIGKNLHEDPAIPCFVSNGQEGQTELVEGMTLAIEVMYTNGTGELVLEDDSWTLSTKDAKIAALFEETVAVTSDGPIILTKSDLVLTKDYGKE